MFTFLSWLGTFLSGPIMSGALKAYQAKLAAGNTSDKIAADLAVQQAQVDARKEELEQATVQVEESRWFPLVRWGFAMPFVIYDWKVVVWDMVLGKGVTDHLAPEMLNIQMIIIGAYFGHSALTNIGRGIALAGAKKT